MVATATRTILENLERIPDEGERTKIAIVCYDTSLYFFSMPVRSTCSLYSNISSPYSARVNRLVYARCLWHWRYLPSKANRFVGKSLWVSCIVRGTLRKDRRDVPGQHSHWKCLGSGFASRIQIDGEVFSTITPDVLTFVALDTNWR